MSISDSRFAVYEGLIALAWADHELSEEEKEHLHQMVNGNMFMSESQKNTLNAHIDNRFCLHEVWPHISDKMDRAFLLNAADALFHIDGNYCDNEQEMYNHFLSEHLITLDKEKMELELRDLGHIQEEHREQLRNEMKEYAKEYSLVERLRKLLDKDSKG